MAKFVAKLLLVILNIIYFLAAVAILTIGCLSLTGDPMFIDLLNVIEETTVIQNILDVQVLTLGASIYLVTLGSLAVLLAILGSCGALTGPKWILVLYGVAKLCIILFNLALIMYNSIVPFHGKENVQRLLLENLEMNYEPTRVNGSDIILPTADSPAYYWATMEFNEACCAAGGYEEYKNVIQKWEGQLTNSTDAIYKSANISASCCMQIRQHKIPTNTNEFTNLPLCITSAPDHANSRGCIDYVMSVIINYRQIYILTAAAFIALEVLAISLTIRVHRDRNTGVGVF